MSEQYYDDVDYMQLMTAADFILIPSRPTAQNADIVMFLWREENAATLTRFFKEEEPRKSNLVRKLRTGPAFGMTGSSTVGSLGEYPQSPIHTTVAWRLDCGAVGADSAASVDRPSGRATDDAGVWSTSTEAHS